MATLRLCLTAFALGLLSACLGSSLDRGSNPFGGAPTDASIQLPATLRGEVPSSDGQTVKLEDTTDRPVVLVFSQETCVVCIGEAEHIRDSLPGGVEPTNAKVITVLVGADRSIADEWKSTLHLPWTVAYDEDAVLFKSYCPEKLTPCTLIQRPGDGVVFRKTGEVELEEIKNLIGEWR